MNQDYKDKQLSLCKRFGVDCLSSADFQKVGVSSNILDQSWSWPVHGLRCQPHSEATGWYIWSGEFSEAADFFQPLHVSHLTKYCEAALAYLGLPPGWRFLIAPDHEDVWFDKKLLDVKGE